ncbi:hypothetical protein SS05631_c14530 [Sinorhizobium sp. CCBAU 05631]|nr:hypothetical protein SS05631_c14530 [Sinorhizobium sp. CCBAU 05631]
MGRRIAPAAGRSFFVALSGIVYSIYCYTKLLLSEGEAATT